MTWQDACKTYPNQWLLIEVMKAQSKGRQRILEDIDVFNYFIGSREAFSQYKILHHANQSKEYYVAHTSHETL